MSKIQLIMQDLIPPLVWRSAKSAKRSISQRVHSAGNGASQELDVYWDPKMAAALETWGEGNAWNEIQLLMLNAQGKVLDIACGTGKVMTLLKEIGELEVYGCDISDFLLEKAVGRGICREHLICCDATDLPYPNKSFDYAYSIGSLEHFTEEGIDAFLRECKKVVAKRSFHMIPVSRSQKNEGWINPWQSYYNNSTDWWVTKCKAVFDKVTVFDSAWNDEISTGKWLVCDN